MVGAERGDVRGDVVDGRVVVGDGGAELDARPQLEPLGEFDRLDRGQAEGGERDVGRHLLGRQVQQGGEGLDQPLDDAALIGHQEISSSTWPPGSGADLSSPAS
nr:hypothetical protein [Kitasatospora cheerisanensis]